MIGHMISPTSPLLSLSWSPFLPPFDDDMDVDDPSSLPPITSPPPGATLLHVAQKPAHVPCTPPPPPTHPPIYPPSQVSPSKQLRKLIKLDSTQDIPGPKPAEPQFSFQDLVPFTEDHMKEPQSLPHLIIFHQPLQPTQELSQPNPYSGPVAPSQPPRTFGYKAWVNTLSSK